jgi:hypothetical protein
LADPESVIIWKRNVGDIDEEEKGTQDTTLRDSCLWNEFLTDGVLNFDVELLVFDVVVYPACEFWGNIEFYKMIKEVVMSYCVKGSFDIEKHRRGGFSF